MTIDTPTPDYAQHPETKPAPPEEAIVMVTTIVREYLSGGNLIHPAMHFQVTGAQPCFHCRMRLQVLKLQQHIVLRQPAQSFFF